MKKILGVLICLSVFNVCAAVGVTTQYTPQTSVNTTVSYKQIRTIDDVDVDYVSKLLIAGKFSEAAKYMDYAINSLDKNKYADEINEIRIINALAKYKAGDMNGAKAEYDELYKVYGYSLGGSFTSFISELNTAYNYETSPEEAERVSQNISALSSSSEKVQEISQADEDKLIKLAQNGDYKKLVTEIDKHLTKVTKNNNLELYIMLISMRTTAKYKLGDDKGAREDYAVLKSIYGSMMNSYEQFTQAADDFFK